MPSSNSQNVGAVPTVGVRIRKKKRTGLKFDLGFAPFLHPVFKFAFLEFYLRPVSVDKNTDVTEPFQVSLGSRHVPFFPKPRLLLNGFLIQQAPSAQLGRFAQHVAHTCTGRLSPESVGSKALNLR